VEDELADVESMCEALRTELRRENVHYLERVLNELFDELYQSDSYERIELSEEYHLTVHEKGGETMNPRHLSGGEKNIFNLALRCAIYKLLSEGMEGGAPLPPLILDEPTANLDSEHVDQIANVVDTVRQLGIDQTLVVSHNKEVVSSSDEQIRVETKDTSNRSTANREVADPLGL